MNDQEQFLSEALQKAVSVDDGRGRYREVAFPIILQALVESGAEQSRGIEPGDEWESSI